MKKAVISDPPESLGQNMLKHKIQKILPFQGSVLSLARFAFSVLKCHPSIMISHDILFTKHSPI